jgi:hypothetical protein
MNKVAISAAVGTAVAGALFAAPYVGVHVSPNTLMLAAAALSVGGASAVLTSQVIAKPPRRGGSVLMKERLADTGLILRFPKPSESMALSIRPDTKPEFLDVVKSPEKYASKDIVVFLRGSKESKFNPVLLRQLFIALSRQGNFLHVILTGKNDEFVGYIPGGYARLNFAGGNGTSLLTTYVVEVFDDLSKSALLRDIGGAGQFDVISDTAEVSELMRRMAGGYKRLVVLRNGYHRKPVGTVDFSDVVNGTLTGSAPPTLSPQPDLRK